MVELTQIDLIVLLVAAFATSVISAILGMAGGISLLAVMMQYFPQTLLIPMHGIVQLVSNGFRTALNFKYVEMRILGPLLIGSVVGAVVGYHFVLSIPQTFFAFFMLFPLGHTG